MAGATLSAEFEASGLRRKSARSHRKESFSRQRVGARLVGVGTATPPFRYSQQQILELFGETDPKVQRLFRNSHIESRCLYLPTPVDGRLPNESNQQLIDKHLAGCLEIGPAAIKEALRQARIAPCDVDFVCCVSSTGFLCPGLSAHLTAHMGFREDVRRVDILGMGCNAAMNGLQVVTSFVESHPQATALLVCMEVCSAAYVRSEKLSTAVVNSLFGDGAAAGVFRYSEQDDWTAGPAIGDTESQIIVEALQAMRYELDETKLSFYLDREIPYVIGRNVERPVLRLLGRHGLRMRDVDHWIIHSGGKKVIDAIEYNLGLTDYDVRHTLSVLRKYGNLSSGSVFFSYKALRDEGVVDNGDLGILIAMGPGTSIETALLCW